MSTTSIRNLEAEIEKRKQAEKTLEISKAAYQSLVDNVLDQSEIGLFILDADFKIVWINRAIESFCGLERKQIIGKDKRQLILTRLSDIFENPQEYIDKVISTYDNNTFLERFECHVLSCAKRQDRWLEHRSLPILAGLYAGGRMEYYIDITDRKCVEQERQCLLEQLRDKTHEMEHMLSIVSHDLRSPLVNVQGFAHELEADGQKLMSLIENSATEADLAQLKILQQNIEESLNIIVSSVTKMDGLLAALNSLVKVGRVELKIEPLDMNEICQGVVDSIKTQINQYHAQVLLDKLPKCKGDNTYISHIFTNLLVNSLKYSYLDRTPKIHIYGKTEGGMSIYSIEDNGRGIPESHLEKIFDIFHRVDPNGPVSGEGLGLSAVRRIIGRHHGRVWVESQEGKSTTFYVAIPTTL